MKHLIMVMCFLTLSSRSFSAENPFVKFVGMYKIISAQCSANGQIYSDRKLARSCMTHFKVWSYYDSPYAEVGLSSNNSCGVMSWGLIANRPPYLTVEEKNGVAIYVEHNTDPINDDFLRKETSFSTLKMKYNDDGSIELVTLERYSKNYFITQFNCVYTLTESNW